MPAYNFKPQFAADVESGKKTQTIRPQRKRPTRAGETLKLYTAMRTRECRLLAEAVCKMVLPVQIYHNAVVVDGRELGVIELEWLAKMDGFETAREFFDFFIKTYELTPLAPLENMELIQW